MISGAMPVFTTVFDGFIASLFALGIIAAVFRRSRIRRPKSVFFLAVLCVLASPPALHYADEMDSY
jgi:hypothetical protein